MPETIASRDRWWRSVANALAELPVLGWFHFIYRCYDI